MQCKLYEAIDKLKEIDSIINAIEDEGDIGVIDLRTVYCLLDEYREILSNVAVKI